MFLIKWPLSVDPCLVYIIKSQFNVKVMSSSVSVGLLVVNRLLEIILNSCGRSVDFYFYFASAAHFIFSCSGVLLADIRDSVPHYWLSALVDFAPRLQTSFQSILILTFRPALDSSLVLLPSLHVYFSPRLLAPSLGESHTSLISLNLSISCDTVISSPHSWSPGSSVSGMTLAPLSYHATVVLSRSPVSDSKGTECPHTPSLPRPPHSKANESNYCLLITSLKLFSPPDTQLYISLSLLL